MNCFVLQLQSTLNPDALRVCFFISYILFCLVFGGGRLGSTNQCETVQLMFIWSSINNLPFKGTWSQVFNFCDLTVLASWVGKKVANTHSQGYFSFLHHNASYSASVAKDRTSLSDKSSPEEDLGKAFDKLMHCIQFTPFYAFVFLLDFHFTHKQTCLYLRFVFNFMGLRGSLKFDSSLYLATLWHFEGILVLLFCISLFIFKALWWLLGT